MGKAKRNRFVAVGGIIAIVVILAIAFASAGTTSKTVSVAEAASPDARGQRIEVTGNVVDNSFSIDGDTLAFQIYDADEPADTLAVVYDKGVAATFGNGVTAICTGTVDEAGVLQASELVTKCPSKYETMTGALSVAKLLGYGEAIVDKPVKVEGLLEPGSLKGVDAKARLVLDDADDAQTTLPVSYAGAIPQTVQDGSRLVLTGSMNDEGAFVCTNLAEAQEG